VSKLAVVVQVVEHAAESEILLTKSAEHLDRYRRMLENQQRPTLTPVINQIAALVREIEEHTK
jgi:hypothetical protein